MFKKRVKRENAQSQNSKMEAPVKTASAQDANTLLKGSKLIGDINVTCDLELSGEIEGNITSLKDSSISINGTCTGNIETREGNVRIEGILNSGNIIAGGDVTITGTFSGNEIKSGGKLRIDGEFKGSLQANEIELGPNARGRGEIVYKDFISISRGAKIEGTIQQLQSELKLVKSDPDTGSVEKQPDVKKAAASVRGTA